MKRLDYDPILNSGFSFTASCINFQIEFRFLLMYFIVSVPFKVFLLNIIVLKEVLKRLHLSGYVKSMHGICFHLRTQIPPYLCVV